MKYFYSVLFAACLLPATAVAQNTIMEPIAAPANPDAVPLYAQGEIPDSDVAENWSRATVVIDENTRVENIAVRNVTWPTLTPVLPSPDKATGAGVLVAPGGAFHILAIEHEGFAIARQLADRGIAAFVLKYRIKPTPADDAAFGAFMGKVMAGAIDSDGRPTISEPRAGADALQALRLIRARADEWNVDPARLGFIGFSAGAMTGLQAVLTGKPDEQPDFLGYIYGPMSGVEVPAHAPPLFAAIAMDDELFSDHSFDIVNSWARAGLPVELHAYERGGHGFGAGLPGTTTTGLLDQFVAWLKARGVLSE